MMKSFRLIYCVILSSGLLGAVETAVAQDEQVTIAQNTLKGFQAPHTSINVNEVAFLDYAAGTTSIEITNFKNYDHSITAGQTFDHAFLEKPGMLAVVAGRDGSSTPVDWLKQKHFALKENPKELNFALAGDLILDARNVSSGGGHEYTGSLTCTQVALAQGHGRTRNDWWMFSNISLDSHFDYNNGGMNFAHGRKLTISCTGDSNEKYNVDLAIFEKKGVPADSSFTFVFVGINAVSE
jgi:hypothetical protein